MSSVPDPVRQDRRGGELWISSVMFPAWCIGVAIFAIHMLTAGRYGYFRDEFYFFACSDHLSAGYVDFAPLSAWILKLNRILLGDSLYALRFLPAVAHGYQIILTGMLVREMGGKRFAVLLSGLGVALAPAFLAIDSRYSMNQFEPLFWMGTLYLLLRVVNGGSSKLVLWAGVCCGIGIENKHSTVFFVGALFVALLLSPERRLLKSGWLWSAVGIIFVLSLPNFIWQAIHGFPTYVDLMYVRTSHKNVELPPLPFIKQQVMMLNPLISIAWIPGIYFFFFGREGRRYRVIGWTFLIFFVELLVLKGKDYYVAPIYPVVFAAGAIVWETLSEVRIRWVRPALAMLILIAGAISAPIVLPILSPEKASAYAVKLGATQRTEVEHSAPLPQHFADEFGWTELVAAVSQLYHSLPPEDQARTAILGGSYGDAGAVDFFGPGYGLPKSISAHQSYWYWGPRDYTGESVILLHWPRDAAERHCAEVVEGPTLNHPWSMDEEHYTIWLCKGMKPPLQEFWPRLKHWN